jgi:predicted nucleotidyltransferase
LRPRLIIEKQELDTMKPFEVLEMNRQARAKDRADSDLDIPVNTLPGKTRCDPGDWLEEMKEIMHGHETHLLVPGDLPEKVRVRVLDGANPA